MLDLAIVVGTINQLPFERYVRLEGTNDTLIRMGEHVFGAMFFNDNCTDIRLATDRLSRNQGQWCHDRSQIQFLLNIQCWLLSTWHKIIETPRMCIYFRYVCVSGYICTHVGASFLVAFRLWIPLGLPLSLLVYRAKWASREMWYGTSTLLGVWAGYRVDRGGTALERWSDVGSHPIAGRHN